MTCLNSRAFVTTKSSPPKKFVVQNPLGQKDEEMKRRSAKVNITVVELDPIRKPTNARAINRAINEQST